MDNEKARKILYQAIDGEASKMELEEFEAHLNENKALKARFDFENRFRKTVAKVASGDASGDASDESSAEMMSDSLRALILDKLDEIDAEELASEIPEFENTKDSPLNITQPNKRFSSRYLTAMAASFALILIGLYATVTFFGHQSAFGSFENAHYIARDQGDEFGQAESAIDATSFISQNFGVGLSEEIDGLSLCGGEVLKLDNSEFAHFKFCDENNQPVSIFVGSAADYTLPAMPSTIVAGKEYFSHSCHGCELMYWRSGDALIIAASAPDHMDNRHISDLVRGAGEESTNATDSTKADNSPAE